MSLNQIIFDHIDNKYCYGKYGDFKVIMMTSNRYINATKLCKEYNKKFKHWNENKSNIELINEVEKEIRMITNENKIINKNNESSTAGIPADENNKPIILIKGGKNELIRGSYVHELLIPHIASWVSPIFAIKVSKIINNFITNEYINEIKNKNNKIDFLEEKLNNIIEQNKELLESNEKMHKSLNDANYKLDETLEKLDISNDKLEETKDELEDINEKLDITDKTLVQVAKKLNIAVEDRVINTKNTLTLEYFVIYKNNNSNIKYKYYIIRGQKKYIIKKSALLNNYEEIKTIECCPNSTILWNLIKEELNIYIDWCGNKLNLVDINQENFLLKVDEIYNKRKNIILDTN